MSAPKADPDLVARPLPARGPSRVRDTRASFGQLRARRRRIAQRVHRRGGALASRRNAQKSCRLVDFGGAVQGHRSTASRTARHRVGRRRRTDRRPRGRHTRAGRTQVRGRRPPAADLHLLPPEPVRGGVCRANFARGVRAHDEAIARACLRTPGTLAQRIVRAKAEDPRRRHSLPGPGHGRTGRRGSRTCCASSIWFSTKAIRRLPAKTC